MHGCGLVHRDLKPGNVLLAADGPHVIDFGISRAFEGTQLTSAGMVVGTPGYMSPEQAEGSQAGPPSDVFSLGCVLAYAATGNAPFGGGSAASILYRVVTGEPDLGGIPAGLQQVITACLAKDPAQRIGLAQLTAMVSALGPPLPGTIGAFWPEPLAGIIAADQAPHPATQVGGAPVSPAQGGPVPGLGGPGLGGPGLGGPGLGGPGLGGAALGGPGLGGRTWAGSPVQAGQPQGSQGVASAATGHAPMVADGYYAAAAGNMGRPGLGHARARRPGSRRTASRSPGSPRPASQWPPQYPGDPASSTRPASSRAPGSRRPVAARQTPFRPQAAMPSGRPRRRLRGRERSTERRRGRSRAGPAGPGGARGGARCRRVVAAAAAVFRRFLARRRPAERTRRGQLPQRGTPLGQYAPGRRRPTKAELPTPVLGAARLMYLGAVVTALNILFGNHGQDRLHQRRRQPHARGRHRPGRRRRVQSPGQGRST